MHTQDHQPDPHRTVDNLHNQDKVLKESFTLFQGGSLAFLDETLAGEVTEILTTEITETSTKKAYGDTSLKLSTNIGVHSEWQVDITEEDMARFASYHIDFARMHKIPFTTIIITAKKPRVTAYKSPSMHFTPTIINLKDRDADNTLAEIERKLQAGEPINELEIIYLPLYGSKSGKTTPDLLDAAIKLTPAAARGNKSKQQKLCDLLILLSYTFMNKEKFYQILEDNMRILEDNPAILFFEERGLKKGLVRAAEQTARNLLRRGYDMQAIAEDTGLTLPRVVELQAELHAKTDHIPA